LFSEDSFELLYRFYKVEFCWLVEEIFEYKVFLTSLLTILSWLVGLILTFGFIIEVFSLIAGVVLLFISSNLNYDNLNLYRFFINRLKKARWIEIDDLKNSRNIKSRKMIE